MEIYKNLKKVMKIKWKIGNPRKLKKNQPLIKHFIKELMRKIGRPFLEICENLGNRRIPKNLYGNL